MTTPREDAIAALAAWLHQKGIGCVSGETFCATHRDDAYDIALSSPLAALAAEAETPDHDDVPDLRAVRDGIEQALALVYAADKGYPGVGARLAVARVCDEVLDRSGAMLGRVRSLAALAAADDRPSWREASKRLHDAGADEDSGHWVNLASPEAAERLARVLHDNEYHPCTGDYESCVALGEPVPTWREGAERLLAAMRETGR